MTENFSYKNYKPLDSFDKLKDYEALTALILLLSDLEAHIPGTIKHLLSVVSLIDGGFRLNSSVSEKSSERAKAVQDDFVEVLVEKIHEIS